MGEGVLISILLAAVSIGITIAIWVASTHAAKVTAENESPPAILRKVDADAYERARRIYEGAIEQLESEVNRLQQQLSEQNTRAERQAREFEVKVAALNAEVGRLLAKIRADIGHPNGQ